MSATDDTPLQGPGAEIPDRDGEREQLQRRLAEKQAELDELKSKLPAHSLRPHQLAEVEDAEDAVSDLEAELRRVDEDEG